MSRKLTLSVIRAEKLPQMNLVARGADAYVEVVAEGKTYSTECVENSSTPIWNKDFDLSISSSSSVKVIVKDDRFMWKDGVIGSATLGPDALSQDGEAWLQLYNSDGKNSGTILVEIANKGGSGGGSGGSGFSKTQPVNFTVTVVQAEHLTFDSSLFVKLASKGNEKSTGIRDDTSNPVWRESFKFQIAPGEHVVASLWGKRTNLQIREENLGEVRIPFKEFDKIAREDLYLEARLKDSNGMPIGLLVIGATTEGSSINYNYNQPSSSYSSTYSSQTYGTTTQPFRYDPSSVISTVPSISRTANERIYASRTVQPYAADVRPVALEPVRTYTADVTRGTAPSRYYTDITREI